MLVKVESTWSGGDKHSFRLEYHHRGRYRRLSIPAHKPGSWSRKDASNALDFITLETPGLDRKSIRFDIR